MKLDPTTYHRMRLEAALIVYQEAEAAPVEHLAAWDKGVWSRADTFLAAGGYECGEEAEPLEEEWFRAWREIPDGTLQEPHLFCREASRRAHELARQRSQK